MLHRFTVRLNSVFASGLTLASLSGLDRFLQYISSNSYNLDELLFFLSEFIEDIRVEKQAAGIQKAKDECRRLGRPPKLTAKEVLKAIELKQNNTSQQVANRFGVGRSTLYRHIAKYKEAS